MRTRGRSTSLFDFYASLGSGGSYTTIGFNAYKQLVADAGLALNRSKHCDDSHLDQLFTSVNAAGAVAAAAAARATGIKVSGSRAFARSETLQMLVRVAIARYVLDGDETDVSQAVHTLVKHVCSRLVPQAKQTADDFRRQYCYVEAVHDVLFMHRRSLRALFEIYADFRNLKTSDQKIMCFDDWMLLLKHLHFFDEAFQQREGTLAFVFSRMRVIDEESERGKKKMTALSFEDFLEALVRCATMKALPTKAELLVAGAHDAGLFLVELRANPQAYNTFVEARERAYEAPLRQPIERCVEHLISLVIRTVETSIKDKPEDYDFRISKNEIIRFYRQGGARIVDTGNTGGGGGGAAQSEFAAKKPPALLVRQPTKNVTAKELERRTSSENVLAHIVPHLESKALKWGNKAKKDVAHAAGAQGQCRS